MDVDWVSAVLPRRRFDGWEGAGGSAGARGDLLGTLGTLGSEDSGVFPLPEPPEEDLGAGLDLAALNFAEGR